jgi:hypothetical protein
VSNASTLTILTEGRAMAAALVERAMRSSGSKMAAYETVARQTGVSPVWLRGFINNHGNAKPNTSLLNIYFQYRKVLSQEAHGLNGLTPSVVEVPLLPGGVLEE